MADEEENTKNTAYESAMAKFAAESDKMISFIHDYITGEKYLDTLALLLIYAGKEKAQAILANTPDEIAQKLKDKLTAIALKGDGIKRDSPEVISAVGTVMRKEGFFGAHSAKSLLENLSTTEQKEFRLHIDELFEINPLLAMNAEQNLFDFEDIVILDDRSIQKILREVDTQQLAKALKGTGEEVQDKIFRNMSRRAAGMLKEDMEFMGPVRALDVEEEQSNIVKIIMRLERDGEIVIPRNDGEEMI